MKAKPDTDSGLSMRKLPGCVPSRKGAHSARPFADAELNCRGRRLLGQGRFVHGIDHLTPTDNEGQTKYKTKSSGTDYGDGRIISRQPEPSLRYRACVRKTRCFHLSGTLKVEHFPSVTSLPFPPCPSDPVCVATRSVYQRE